MHTRTILTAVLSLLSATAAHAQAPAPDYEAGEAVTTHNLAVVPLYTKKAPPYDEYLVLEEAQKQKAVTIREVDEGGSVNQLRVKNRDTDKRPLYLLGGEVVLGGKQDRMVVNDTVVEPGKAQLLAVMCVEAHRWDGADLTFKAGSAVAHPGLRQAALFKGQSAVWDEVARKSAASNVSSETGTFRRVLQDGKVRQRIGAYLDELEQQIGKDARLTGFAVAINGELEVVDVFDSPTLLAKLERKLLASYVLAALERQPGSPDRTRELNARAKSIGKKKVDEFISNSVGQGVGTGTEQAGENEAQAPTRPAKGANVFNYKGKAVHGTFFGGTRGKE